MPITWSETDQISNIKYISHVNQMFKIIINFLMKKDSFFEKKNNEYSWKVIKNCSQ